jgi:hypothetical protein
MRIRFRYGLTTLLLLPLLVGIGIKWYRGPHEFSLAEYPQVASLPPNVSDLDGGYILGKARTGSFWAYRNLDGSLTRHGTETSIGPRRDKMQTEFRGGLRNGTYRYWNAERELVCEGQFEHDEPVGEWVYYRLGVPYQRVQYDVDRQVEIQSRYDLDRLAERRTRTRGSEEVRLTAWHPNGQKRVEGWLLQELPVRKWQWWDKEGRETLAVTFHDGIPEEFVGQLTLEEFVRSDFDYESQGAPLESLMNYFTEFRMRIECGTEDLQRARKLGISTDGDFGGGLAIYLALRRVGLTLGTRNRGEGTESLVIVSDGEN